MTAFTADCLRLHAGLCQGPEEAATVLGSAARLLEARPSVDSRELADLYFRIGTQQAAAGRYPAAIANLNVAILMEAQLTAEGRPLEIEPAARRTLAAASLEYGDVAAASRHLSSPACLAQRHHPEWTVLWARVLVARGQTVDAIRELERKAGPIDYVAPGSASGSLCLALGSALRMAGRVTAARKWLQRARACWSLATGGEVFRDAGPGLTLLELGRCDLAAGHTRVAGACFKRAEELLSAQLGERHPAVARVLVERARVEESQHDFYQARVFALRAIMIQRSCLPLRHPDLAAAQLLEARACFRAEPVNFAMLA